MSGAEIISAALAAPAQPTAGPLFIDAPGQLPVGLRCKVSGTVYVVTCWQYRTPLGWKIALREGRA